MKKTMLLLSIFFLIFSKIYAQSSNTDHIPTDLQKWIPWVLKQHPEWNCPKMANEFKCLWTNDLSINVINQKAILNISVFNANRGDTDELLPLPFHEDFPPSRLMMKNLKTQENSAIALVEVEGKFFVSVPPGEYEIKGELSWTEEPEYINVPSNIYSKIKLSRQDKMIPWYKYEEDRLWLQKEAS